MPPYFPFYYLFNTNPQTIMEMSRYFYHPDHLGSSSWITDGSGQAIQHLHYLPFGEDWVDQRNSSWNAPYTFSGKEKDVETYGYFGARYYDSGLSIWLSVDPMSDKYPSMSPYNYCANNPVILVDPDGRDWYEAEDGSKTWKEGNDATIEQNGVKYKNIGTSTTISYMDGKYDIKFEQNSPIELTEHVLKNDDFRTQMNSDGTKKAGEAGNCFYQAGQMVESSGATSLNGTANNISNRQDGVN